MGAVARRAAAGGEGSRASPRGLRPAGAAWTRVGTRRPTGGHGAAAPHTHDPSGGAAAAASDRPAGTERTGDAHRSATHAACPGQGARSHRRFRLANAGSGRLRAAGATLLLSPSG